MKKVLIIGSGIAGLCAAIECADRGMEAIMVSPFPSERAQSVLAAGGINAVLTADGEDSIGVHVEDTLKGGLYLAGKKAVQGLCEDAPKIIRWLESKGTVFTTKQDGTPDQRAFGGQSHKRTCYCGAATGKQIVTALVMEARRLEGTGRIRRIFWMDFYKALIRDGICYGAIFYNESKADLEMIPADSVIFATGGQNTMFGKTTGSTLCDGYAHGRLFTQGVELKNLEFIQYHPTTLETAQKRLLVSEAVRGEGGRLYYMEQNKRVYFMEELYGERGNLMPRDVVSAAMERTGREIFLDISFLGKEKIQKRIPEVYDLCLKYRGIDISKESIPVSPGIHFFMGGIAVKNDHETCIRHLYAIGECAAIYHGANRLGGNSLLAAIHGARVAAAGIDASLKEAAGETLPDGHFAGELEEERNALNARWGSKSPFPVKYIKDMLAETMCENLGIEREKVKLRKGMDDVDYFLSVQDKIRYDKSEMPYLGFSLPAILNLAKAVLVSADFRKESRGSHIRKDHPEKKKEWEAATIISYDQGAYRTRLDMERAYES